MASRRQIVPALVSVACLASGCLGSPDGQTLANLRTREPDLAETRVDHGLEQAMEGYRRFLEEAPTSSLTPEAMRRLADLQLEREYGSLGVEADEQAASLPHPMAAGRLRAARQEPEEATDASVVQRETVAEFERRTLGGDSRPYAEAEDVAHPQGHAVERGGPLEAIALYDQILRDHPDYPQNDQVLYQKARALDELGRVDEAVVVAAELVARFPASPHVDEAQFRRGEYFFTRKKFFDAEEAYGAIVSHGPSSDYYELALYKLGWTFYKQMLLDEAVGSYLTLLDHKVATDYDFDQTEDEASAQRISDAFRVASLCFSDLGGAEAVKSFFASHGTRSYEDRVYRQLGEFYLEKLRYHDAALAYGTFVDLYPSHPVAPRFSMRVVEIYEAGQFPKLVVEAKKNFAVQYQIGAPFWQSAGPDLSAEVLVYLEQNLRDLANHYHALYQEPARPEDRPAHFAESEHWYREYLAAFPETTGTPAIHYRFADLLLENEHFEEAAGEYEKIAYGYPTHEQAASAGYAAVFARREQLKRTAESEAEAVDREVVASSMRFADAFPQHEHVPQVLSAAAEDLYGLGENERAIAVGRRLIAAYPDADPEIRRASFTVVAHASFDSSDFVAAEEAYVEVLALTPIGDESISQLKDNLAAAVYKQAELASEAEDHRSAAEHFLRITTLAPESAIGALAEYDAAAALIQLEAWDEAAAVLEDFRTTHPDHELIQKATRQIAFVYERAGDPSRAAEEHERVAANADDPELRMESLLAAGSLFEESGELDRALRSYGQYVADFGEPIDRAVAIRFKMAELHDELGDETAWRAELERIVAIDASAGTRRTPAVRSYGGRSALLLSEGQYDRFAAIELSQPFDKSLARKRSQLQTSIGTFEKLIDYGVPEVTAAATFYIAQIYTEFSRALIESEHPPDLSGSELLDYEDMLEEEAFPFEQKAIEIHQKNLELVSTGVFNDWIERSLSQLAVLMPGRYAKHEIGPGLLDSIDTYAYVRPARPMEDVDDGVLAAARIAPSEVPSDVAESWGDDRSGVGVAAPDPATMFTAASEETSEATDEVDGGSDETYELH